MKSGITKEYFNKVVIIFLSILLFIIHLKHYNREIEGKYFDKLNNSLKINRFEELFESKIEKRTALIFEANRYHFECLPGYAKYFIDLGYKIDILIRNYGIKSFCLFNEINKIRFFVFQNLKQFLKNSKNFTSFIKKYDYVVIQTTNNQNKDLFFYLNLLNLNNTIFVFQNMIYADANYSKFFETNRAWTLGNISKGLQVNPHYFGNIQIKDKNEKSIFFITSTKKRNYTCLVQSALKLKKDNLNFEIIVVGWRKFFNFKNIPNYIADNFSFKYNISFDELYKEINKSDFIIIPFDPNSKYDESYRTTRVSGSIQLAYGFLKPIIIDKDYAKFYSLNHKNSLIYENYDLYSLMKKAVKMSNNEYKQLQNNFNITAQEIYKISLKNVKKTIIQNNKY